MIRRGRFVSGTSASVALRRDTPPVAADTHEVREARDDKRSTNTRRGSRMPIEDAIRDALAALQRAEQTIDQIRQIRTTVDEAVRDYERALPEYLAAAELAHRRDATRLQLDTVNRLGEVIAACQARLDNAHEALGKVTSSIRGQLATPAGQERGTTELGLHRRILEREMHSSAPLSSPFRPAFDFRVQVAQLDRDLSRSVTRLEAARDALPDLQRVQRQATRLARDFQPLGRTGEALRAGGTGWQRLSTAIGGVGSAILGVVASLARDWRDRRQMGFVPHVEDSPAHFLAGLGRMDLHPHDPADVDIARMRQNIREHAEVVRPGQSLTVREYGARPTSSLPSGEVLTVEEVTWERGLDGRFHIRDSTVPPGTRVVDLNRLIDRDVPDDLVRAAIEQPSASESSPTEAEHRAARAELLTVVPERDATAVGPTDTAATPDATLAADAGSLPGGVADATAGRQQSGSVDPGPRTPGASTSQEEPVTEPRSFDIPKSVRQQFADQAGWGHNPTDLEVARDASGKAEGAPPPAEAARKPEQGARVQGRSNTVPQSSDAGDAGQRRARQGQVERLASRGHSAGQVAEVAAPAATELHERSNDAAHGDRLQGRREGAPQVERAHAVAEARHDHGTPSTKPERVQGRGGPAQQYVDQARPAPEAGRDSTDRAPTQGLEDRGDLVEQGGAHGNEAPSVPGSEAPGGSMDVEAGATNKQQWPDAPKPADRPHRSL